MEALSCDTSVRQHMTKLEHQVKYLKCSKESSKDLIESIEETIMNLRIALNLSPKFVIEFDESEIKSGDVINFHPYDSISCIKLIVTENRFYETSTRRFYTTFQEWKETITIPGFIRKMKTPEEVQAEAVKNQNKKEVY